MLRDLLSDQSKPQENQRPQVGQSAKKSEAKKEDEEFVDINHEDAETSQATSKGQAAAGGEDDGNWEDDHSDDEEGEPLERESGFSASISQFLGQRLMRKQTPTKRDSVHPFTSVLSLSNVEDCVRLENSTFPESERGTREKFIYRLSKCPELSFGIFSRAPLSQKKQDGKQPPSELVAHVISTRTSTPHVTDESMALPPDWKTSKRTLPKDGDEKFLGHEDQGGTIAIHSLAVTPEHQGKGIGSTLLKSYVDRIREARIADRIVLIVHEPLIPFYEKFGFQSRGKSEVAHGGGGWHSMVGNPQLKYCPSLINVANPRRLSNSAHPIPPNTVLTLVEAKILGTDVLRIRRQHEEGAQSRWYFLQEAVELCNALKAHLAYVVDPNGV